MSKGHREVLRDMQEGSVLMREKFSKDTSAKLMNKRGVSRTVRASTVASMEQAGLIERVAESDQPKWKLTEAGMADRVIRRHR